MDAGAPLLVFDSGMGGLSVLANIRDAVPSAPIIYCADTAGYPYGTKTEAEIAARVPGLLAELALRYSPRLIVIACNTASTIALNEARTTLDVTIIGTVPAIKPAALASISRVIGVLGTVATVRQRYVDQLSAKFAPDCVVLRYGSARLVALAEAKLRGDPVALDDVRHELDGLLDQTDGARMDRCVLACTHFPLLIEELRAVAPAGLEFVESGESIARRVVDLTAGQEWPAASVAGRAVFTSADTDHQRLAPALARYGLTEIDPPIIW